MPEDNPLPDPTPAPPPRAPRNLACEFCGCQLTGAGEVLRFSDQAKGFRTSAEKIETLQAKIETLETTIRELRAQIAPAPAPRRGILSDV